MAVSSLSTVMYCVVELLYSTTRFILPVCKNCNALKCVCFRLLAYVMQIVQMTGRPPFIDLYIKVISPRTNLMLYLFNLSLSYCCHGVGGWDKNNTSERPSGICPDLHIGLSPVVLYFSLLDADTPLGLPFSVISVVFTNKKGELKCSKFKMFLNAVFVCFCYHYILMRLFQPQEVTISEFSDFRKILYFRLFLKTSRITVFRNRLLSPYLPRT